MTSPAFMRPLAAFEGPFGLLRVLEDTVHRAHVLMNGETMHGWQFRDDDRLDEPTAYYTLSSPVAELFRASGDGASVAVAGLGIGASAALAAPEHRVTFYEIDPIVVDIARDARWFSFVSRARARCEIVVGDALTCLAGRHDLIVIDAFFGDAVPVAFLSAEAVARFASCLAPGGVLAYHITSTSLARDHRPALAASATGLARAFKDARSPRLARDPTLEIDEGFDLSAPVDTRWAVLSPDTARVSRMIEREGWTQF